MSLPITHPRRTPLPQSAAAADPPDLSSSGAKQTNKPGCFRWMSNLRLPYFSEPVGYLLLFFIIVAINGAAVGATSTSGLDRIANLFGYLALVDTLILLVLIVKNSPLYVLFGVSVDQSLVLHRWLGYLVFACVTLHMVLYWVFWERQSSTTSNNGPGRSSNDSIMSTWTNTSYLLGFIAWSSLIVIIVTSFPWVRRNLYDFFLFFHFFFIVFFVGAIGHEGVSAAFIVIGMLFYGYDKILQWFRYRNRFPVTNIDVTHTDMVKLRFVGKLPRIQKPAQFVFVCVPAMSSLQWHPYTMTSSPTCPEHEVCIRSMGDHTKSLYAYAIAAKSKPAEPMKVCIDGPFGAAGPAFAVSKAPIKVMVAGGIGVTPVISLLRHFYRRVDPVQPPNSVVLNNMPAPLRSGPEDALLAAGTLDNLHTTPNAPHIYCVWTVSHEEHFEWFRTELETIAATARADPSLPRFNLAAHVTRASTPLSAPCQPGRPDVPALLVSLSALHDCDISVFVCGPLPLIDSTWDTVSALQRQGHPITCHRESFEF